MDVNPSDGSFAESSVAAFTRSRAAFDLKGVMSSLTVLRLRSRDLNLIERQLRAKVMQYPQFFHNSPIVLDVSEIEGGIAGFPLAALVRALHVCKVVPVAVTNIDDANRPMAAAAGLGVVALSASRPAGDPDAASDGGVRHGTRAEAVAPAAPTTPAPAPVSSSEATTPGYAQANAQVVASVPPTSAAVSTPAPAQVGHSAGYGSVHSPAQSYPQAAAHPHDANHGAANGHAYPPPNAAPARPAPAPSGHRAPLVVRQPVRSGQLIYAENNDLIVLAPVNPGAQIVADGNIHVYANMRGRAVAGAKGYVDARIFCQRFEAELIAIAGAYLTFDDIPKDRMGKPAQVYLQNGVCVIGAL